LTEASVSDPTRRNDAESLDLTELYICQREMSMTNTDGNTNEGRTELPTQNSVFGFFTELTKTPVLFFFIIGFACLVFAISANIPGVGKVSGWGTFLLLLVGVFLMYTSFKDHRRTVRLQEQKDKYKNGLEQEQGKYQELSQAVGKALELLEEKDDRDRVDSEVLQILREKTVLLLQELQPDQKLIADWLNRKDRRSRLTDFLRTLDYAFLANENEAHQFFEDIDAHLNLLSKNLRSGGYRSPQVEGLKKRIGDSSAYVQAFRDLKSHILSEAENERTALESSDIGYLRGHIDAFISFIND